MTKAIPKVAVVCNDTGQNVAVSVCFYGNQLTVYLSNSVAESNHLTADMIQGEMCGPSEDQHPVARWGQTKVVKG